MATQCTKKCVRALVGQTKLFCGTFHDSGNFPVMHVVDVWKQVVLNLKVKSAYIPRKPLASVAEICRGHQLMDGPIVFEYVRFVGQGELRAVNNMRWLKNYGKRESGEIMHDENADQNLPPE